MPCAFTRCTQRIAESCSASACWPLHFWLLPSSVDCSHPFVHPIDVQACSISCLPSMVGTHSSTGKGPRCARTSWHTVVRRVRDPTGQNRERLTSSTGLALAWSSVLLFDVVVFLLTVIRAFQVWQAGRIVHVVLRDGLMYFWYIIASPSVVCHR